MNRLSYIIYPLIAGACLFACGLQGQNIARVNYSGPFGAQVNTYNGNLYLERTDVVIPNQDLPLGLTFFYNSFRDSTDLGFGYGWTHSYAMRCLPFEGGAVIERPQGRRDSFLLGGDAYEPPPGIFDELEEPSEGVFILTTKHGMAYHFSSPSHHYLTDIYNTNGSRLALSYTDSLLTAVSGASGRSLILAWNAGRLVQVIDNNFPGGRAWNYDYDEGAHLECVLNPVGDCAAYGYDDEGRLIQVIDERDYELRIQYDRANRVSLLKTCITEVNLDYNTEQRRTYIREQNEGGDEVTVYIYDEEGKLARKTGNCCGYDVGYTYDGENNISKIVDANGYERTAGYDANGNTVVARDALSYNQQFEFGLLSRMQSFTDKRGNTSTFEYDGAGNLLRLNRPLDITMEMEYDAAGNVTGITDGEGNTTIMAYNGNNYLADIQYPIGQESYGYDDAGNLLSTTDGNGNSTSFAYDGLGRMTDVYDPLGNNIHYEYDAASNLAMERDPEGNVKQYSYDAHSRLISVETPIGTTRYGYDALDNLIGITNAEGHTSTFAYDTRSRLVRERDAEGFTTHYEYDNNGNAIRRVDANMQVTNYEYDALNRLIRKEYQGNTDNFSYDANGNLIRAANNHISLAFTYDALNRLAGKTMENWGLAIRYEYDRAGNRTKMIDPNGGETLYSYDGNNRLTSILNPAGELTEFSYDDGGRLREQRNHNGTYTTYAYDIANRLTAIFNRRADGTILSSYEYEYDARGLRTGMTDHAGAAAAYEYDSENRLTRAVYSDAPNEEYVFDKAGNRLSLTKGGETTDYTYDAAGRIQTAGSTAYDFDGNGNLIRKTEDGEVTQYFYDGESRLIRVALPDGEKVHYQYDPFGNRIGREQGADITRYFLDGDNILFELDGNNNTLARYTSGLELDSWISMRRDGQSYVYHTDALGSTTGLTGAGQELAAAYEYDAYGNILSQEGSVVNPYTYTGREWDESIGFYYYRSRWYDGRIGRFTVKDQLSGKKENPTTFNKYIYTDNNPFSYVDPTGEFGLNLIGGLISLGIEVLIQYNTYGSNFKNWCWGDIATSTAVGFVIPGGNFAKGIRLLDKSSSIRKSIPIINKQRKAHEQLRKKVPALRKRYSNESELIGRAERLEREAEREILLDLPALSSKMQLAGSFLNEEPDEKPCYETENGSQEKVDKNVELPDENNGTGGEFPGTPRTPDINIPIVRSYDPNEIIGPEGVGQPRWVKKGATLPYTILFENDPDFATAAARRVTIYHPFDAGASLASFRLGDFGFGSYHFEAPANTSYYNNRIDLSDSLGIYLDVIAGADAVANRAYWIFESIDPATGLAATLPAELGFLAVNDSITRAGEGFVNFTVKARASAATGARIEAQATIIFDDNPPIPTNIEVNTIDGSLPESRVEDIDTLSPGRYRLIQAGMDEGSGLADFTVFVSVNNQTFRPLAAVSSEQSYTFNGSPDSLYRFFTIARDSVGNVEPMKASGEPACMAVRIASLTNATAGQNNGQVVLEVSGNTGPLAFEWPHDPNLDEAAATGLTGGLYQVFVSDSIGCVVAVSVFIDIVTSTVEPESKLFIYKVFPVPAEDLIQVRFITGEPLVFATIADLQGRVLLRRHARALPERETTVSLDIGQLPAGSYVLALQGRRGAVASSLFVKF